MQNEFIVRLEKYIKRYRRQKKQKQVISILAVSIAILTAYALMLPAISMTGEAYCGKEEHKHGESCYEKVLICTLSEEAETELQHIEGHMHTDSCYEEMKTLICTQEEADGHVHSDCCVDAVPETEESVSAEIVEAYICGQTEGEGAHHHGEECYQIERKLICELPEEEATETIVEVKAAHTHTDSCYEERKICEKEEHEHVRMCFSNPNADIDTKQNWEKSFSNVKLTGNAPEDVLAIVKTQMGYEESTKNYVVTEDGDTKGITRYGQWYGDPYGDWCAMFLSFCMHYAGVRDEVFPYESGCERWIAKLSQEPYLRYQAAEAHIPEPGNLIFFDYGQKGRSDHVGIVSVVNEDATKLKVIEGNSGNRVQEVIYERNDTRILGYAKLPKAEETEIAEPAETEAAETEVETETETEGESESAAIVAIAAEPIEEETQIRRSQEPQRVGTDQSGLRPGTSITHQEILGDAILYGITANTLSIESHMHSNLAAKRITSTKDITVGHYNAGVGGPLIAASMERGLHLQITGGNVVVYTTSDVSSQIQLPTQNSSFVYDTAANLENEIDQMFGHVMTKSTWLMSQPSYPVEGNVLDISAETYPDGVYYIDGLRLLSQNQPKIKKRSGQMIVFNVAETDITINKFEIVNDENSCWSDAQNGAIVQELAQSIIFNMSNALHVRTSNGGILGTFLAPKAEFSIGNTSSGWIVANHVKNPGGEWHFVSPSVPMPVSVELQAQKTVDGAVPDASEKFDFILETRVGSVWSHPQEVQNEAGSIQFSSQYGHAGVHYYRISEKQGTDSEYQYDSAQYIIKVQITESNGALSAQKTYYKTGNIAEITNENTQVSEIVFCNTTADTPGYVLPQTGGIGTKWYRISGLLLLLAAGGFAVYRRRKQNMLNQ